jgi:hypothetical protein
MSVSVSAQDTFKHNRARKNVIVGGMVILVARDRIAVAVESSEKKEEP